MDAAAVVEVFDPGGGPGVDLVADGDGTPVVVLGGEGGPQGLGHGVIPAHGGLPHRHGSCRGAHVGSQLLGGDLCSPISMQHDPSGEGATGGGAHVECCEPERVLCCSPMAYPRIRCECTSRTRRRRAMISASISHGLHETDVECANGEQLPAVVLVVGGGAPDP